MKLTLALILAAFSLYGMKTFVVNTYYKMKYVTKVQPVGDKMVAATAIVKSNNFYAQRYVVLVDMRKAKSADRLSVYDTKNHVVVYQTKAMHGKGSGQEYATRFSNKVNSNCTSLGRYVVTEQFDGKYGKAYRLVGLDNSNSNALARSIVLHSSKYVKANYTAYSLGCPAVSAHALKNLHKYIQTGTLIWIYR